MKAALPLSVLFGLALFGLALFDLALFGLALAQDAPQAAIHNLFAEILILVGCAFLLTAAIGIARFPDFYTRLHASTKLVTLGGFGIFGGAAIAFAPFGITQRILLIAAFFLMTAPLSGYMIARAGYLRGLSFYREEDSVDEWGALGEAVPQADVPDDHKEALSEGSVEGRTA